MLTARPSTFWLSYDTAGLWNDEQLKQHIPFLTVLVVVFTGTAV